jgi:hypothetical protein
MQIFVDKQKTVISKLEDTIEEMENSKALEVRAEISRLEGNLQDISSQLQSQTDSHMKQLQDQENELKQKLNVGAGHKKLALTLKEAFLNKL